MKSDTNNSASKKCHITFQHLLPEASNISYGTIAFCLHSVLADRRIMAANSRTRSMSRKFFLLRWIDNLRVPTPRNENALERSGRVKDVIFANNSTNARIKELLLHAFSDHLDADDLPR